MYLNLKHVIQNILAVLIHDFLKRDCMKQIYIYKKCLKAV